MPPNNDVSGMPLCLNNDFGMIKICLNRVRILLINVSEIAQRLIEKVWNKPK